MLLVPVATPVANPPVVIVATPAVADVHVTVLVITCVVASLYVPVATNCCVNPFEIDGLTGVTAIDCNVAVVTVNTSAGEVTLFKLAVMLLVPTATPVANPPVVIVAVVVT